MDIDGAYRLDGSGIFTPLDPVEHRDEEFDPTEFETLLSMQERHFWYRGRHRFLLHALKQQIRGREGLAAIDVGGGCGGWVQYLQRRRAEPFAELALADSSLEALRLAGGSAKRYQVDTLRTGWRDRWDVVFLLDVLEHIPDDLAAMREMHRILKPGGLLFVTTPAIQAFWTYNDELSRHQRRYTRRDLTRIGAEAGLETLATRYFMFLLSPLLLAARFGKVDLAERSAEELRALVRNDHRVPAPIINAALTGVFNLETPLGHLMPFPWGTSVLGVFRK